MAKYIESTNEQKIEELQKIINDHLDGVYCISVVDTLSHLTNKKWALNFDLIISGVCKDLKDQRHYEINAFVEENKDVCFVEYDDLVQAGYQEKIEIS